MSDSAAFHEIEDAVRKDEMKEWWRRYGTWVVAGAVVVVVAASALVGWRQYDRAQRASASAAYSQAVALIPSDPAAARAELEKQAAGAVEPYRSLAALVSAQLRATPEEQVTALTGVAPTLSERELSDLALVIAGFRSIGTPKAQETVAQLEPLAAPDRPYQASVRELQAMIALGKGDTKLAQQIWTEIVKDRATPQGTTQRASAMLGVHGAAEAK